MLAYLDDMPAAETWDKAYDCHSTIIQVLDDCGASRAQGKSIPPTTLMVFLGVLFNTVTMTLEVTAERLQELAGLLDEWLSRNTVNRKTVEEIVGKLNFVASCVRPGRLFIARLLEFLRGLPKVGQYEVTEEFRKDLLWWKKFLPTYNGVSMMALEEWSRPDEIFASDACLEGCGGWFPEKGEYFHAQFPEGIKRQELSINGLELLTIVVAVKIWGKHWKGKRIVVQCDNEASVWCLNQGKADNSFLLACLREIEMCAATREFEIRGNWISGISNRIPDALSRWDLNPSYREEFRRQVQGRQVKEIFVYEGLFEFAHDW